MRRITTTLVLICLLTLAGFGFAAMGHSGGMHASTDNYLGCIASNAQGSVCPDGSNPLVYALFHLNALQMFLLGVVPPSAAASMLLLLVSLLFVGFLFMAPFPDGHLAAAVLQRRSSIPTTTVSFQERLNGWLALREKCDPALSL